MNLSEFLKKYPDLINDEQDVKFLTQLLSKYDISLVYNGELSIAPLTFGEIISNTFNGNVPAVKGNYSKIEDLILDPEDVENFNKLYSIIPVHNVGNGELALYWLFNYKDPSNPVENIIKNKSLNKPDFTLYDKQVEVKSYKSLNSKITLGKFKEDKSTRNVLNTMFSIMNLNLSFDDVNSCSEVNFTAETLKSSFDYVTRIKTILEKYQIKELNQLYENIVSIMGTYTPEELTKKILISLAINKLKKKPGLEQYIVNIGSEDMKIEYVLIPANAEEILYSKSYEEISKIISVSSAEIQFNFSIFK